LALRKATTTGMLTIYPSESFLIISLCKIRESDKAIHFIMISSLWFAAAISTFDTKSFLLKI